jgi:2-polyprenyl-3-methyl-5-hydroxy-6-metoxy-1,4-benzoquinol methylase
MSPITLDDPNAYFERLAAFEARHWWSAALWRVACHWLDVTLRGRSGLDAIDVGCGAGLTLERLAARPEVASVTGIDPSPEALAYAQRRGHRVVEASALALPFEAVSFDVVTCLDVIQHLPPGGASHAARELARVLRPGGVAIVRTNAGRGGVDPGRLRATLENERFGVVRASRVNMVGSLAQEVRGWLRPSRHRAHPSGGGLPSMHRRGMSHRIMATFGRAEAYAVGRLGWTFPFGHSAMMLAIRGG